MLRPTAIMTVKATLTDAADVQALVAEVVDPLRDFLSASSASLDWLLLRAFLWANSILDSGSSFLVLAFKS